MCSDIMALFFLFCFQFMKCLFETSILQVGDIALVSPNKEILGDFNET